MDRKSKSLKKSFVILEKRVAIKQLAGRITAASLRALQNNPGSPDGFKKRRCVKSEQESVSNETVQAMKDLADNESADFRDAMVSFHKSVFRFTSGVLPVFFME